MTGKSKREQLSSLSPENLALPGYIEIIGLINFGGMGAIYEARNRKNSERLAVKIMQPDHLNDNIAKKRFMNESKAVGSVKSDFIVKLRDYGVTETGFPFMVMEYLEGDDLWHLVIEKGHLSVDDVLDIFIQAATGFGDAHAKGIIHRDLKPSNIMVVDKQSIKIVDFGIAKFFRDDGGCNEEETPLTATGETVGTPLFMSPEQCLGKEVDKRADIYALGLVMYLCLTGKLPIEGQNAVEVFGKQVNMDIELDLVPEVMRGVLRRCLEKAPEDRYSSMQELKDDLIRIREEQSPRFKLTGKQRKSIRSLFLFAGALILGFFITYVLVSIVPVL